MLTERRIQFNNMLEVFFHMSQVIPLGLTFFEKVAAQMVCRLKVLGYNKNFCGFCGSVSSPNILASYDVFR